MCVNQYTMVPAVVNLVATKGKDTYAGLISELTCFKCKSYAVRIVQIIIIVSSPVQTLDNNTESLGCSKII